MDKSGKLGLVTHWPLMLKIFLLGVMSGYPQIFVFSLVSVWLKDTGYSRAAITAFGAVALLYAFNWLLAPLLDRYRAFGLDRRRFWMMAMQCVMLVACLCASQLDVLHGWQWLVAVTLVLTFASALQDVAIDALRIEATPQGVSGLLSMGAGFATAGWFTGYNLGGALGLEMVAHFKLQLMQSDALWPLTQQLVTMLYHGTTLQDLLAVFAHEQLLVANLAWQQVYLYLSGFFVLALVVTWWLYRPALCEMQFGVEPEQEHCANFSQWFNQVVAAPFRDLFQARGVKFALMLLAFVFLFKLGEAFLGRLAIVFYKDIGFSDHEISRYAKIFGWVALMILTLVSGILAGRMKSWKALMFGGIAMAATNLLYAVMAVIGPQTWFLAFAVAADNITSAFATVAFVGFVSTVCSYQRFTGTQYALLASTASFSRMLLASSGGWMLDHWFGGDWVGFFVMTAVMVLPSLLLLWFMRDSLFAGDCRAF